MAKMRDFLVKYMPVAEMKNIALLYGGTSSERDISLLSGKNVGEALTSRGYNVTYIDPKQNEDMDKLRNEKFDIAYIALHGKGGEDGAIQAELEKLGIPYTGSKVQASKNAMNKAVTKEIFKRGKVSSPKYFVVNKHQKTDLEKQIKITGDDVVVKAANEGSSIGLYFAKGKEEIEKAIEKAKDFDDTIIVEQRISGREFTCAVIEFDSEDKEHLGDKLTFDGNNAALPVIEIVPKNEFYDFASKYDEGGSEHICPAEIDDELAQKIQKLALKAHKSLECSGFSRTDILVSDEGQVYALETNTIPGMTSKSLVPDAARAVGISFEDLCELLINNELKKYGSDVANKPQIIAANKMDACQDKEAVLAKLKAEFEPQGYEIYPISGVTREGVKDLLLHIYELLSKLPKKSVVFEPEMSLEFGGLYSNEPFEVTYDDKTGEYVVEGPRIEKMLGYTNLDSEKGFKFFQEFMKNNGILDKLEELGINEGDTVRMYGFSFDYYK